MSNERVSIWTADLVERLTLLWDEGVPTAEMGRRLGITKNAALGKVHRLGLVPRVIAYKPRRPAFDFTGPVCMWPHGHPGTENFHFCGAKTSGGKPYCEEHGARAYLRPKPGKEAAADV